MVVCLSQLLLTTLNDQKNSKKKKGREKEEKGPAIPLLLVTLKTCMKLSAMIVQGFSESDHPLFQLPHMSSYKYFTSKRFKVSVTFSNRYSPDHIYLHRPFHRLIRWKELLE